MGGVPSAHVVSINRPTPQETIIALVVILTQIIGSSYIEFNPVGSLCCHNRIEMSADRTSKE